MHSSILVTQAFTLYQNLRAMVRNGDNRDYKLDSLTHKAWKRYTRRNPSYRKLVNQMQSAGEVE